jgi:hypothetical protein
MATKSSTRIFAQWSLKGYSPWDRRRILTARILLLSLFVPFAVMSTFVGIVLLFDLVTGRAAHEARVEAKLDAQNTTEENLRYHKAIALDIFVPLPRKGQIWSQTKSRWDQVNDERVQAAKLTIDQQACSTVAASVPAQVDPLTFIVTCGDRTLIAFNEETIAEQGKGFTLEKYDASYYSTDPDVLTVKANLRELIFDPDRAHYESVAAYQFKFGGRTLTAYCGEVNSKNSDGEYMGSQRFIASPGASMLELSTPEAIFEKSLDFYCPGEGRPVPF